MLRAFSPKPSLLLGFALSACLAASCQGNGVTSVCPSLPLYRIYPLGDASIADAGGQSSAAAEAEFARAVDAGCVTAPTSFTSDGGAGGMGLVVEGDGNSGAGGSNANAPGHD